MMFSSNAPIKGHFLWGHSEGAAFVNSVPGFLGRSGVVTKSSIITVRNPGIVIVIVKIPLRLLFY